jgi:hypothetical protein
MDALDVLRDGRFFDTLVRDTDAVINSRPGRIG